MGNDQKDRIIEEIFSEAKEAYNRNHQNLDKVDAKIGQLFAFVTALLMLLINVFQVPETTNLLVLYGVSIGLLIGSITILVVAYQPARYLALDTNMLLSEYAKQKYRTRRELLEVIAGQYGGNTPVLRDSMRRKATALKWAAFLTVASSIFIILLKSGGGAL